MRIALASDIHLEFGDFILNNDNKCDVLILSGDICVAKSLRNLDSGGFLDDAMAQRFYDFFLKCTLNFPNVIYIMGNHEHYNGDFKDSYDIIKHQLSNLKNLYVLDREKVTIDGVTFVGGTLWTDMNKEDELTLYQIRSMMNDFRIIKNSNKMVRHTQNEYSKNENGVPIRDENEQLIITKSTPYFRVSTFSPEDAVEDHKKMLNYIRFVVDNKPKEKFVVVGHHCPSRKSIPAQYKNETIMNGGFSSDLDAFIAERPQIKLWTHGHTHNAFDYMIGKTRIVCNPRGYAGYEDDTGYNPNLVLEV